MSVCPCVGVFRSACRQCVCVIQRSPPGVCGTAFAAGSTTGAPLESSDAKWIRFQAQFPSSKRKSFQHAGSRERGRGDIVRSLEAGGWCHRRQTLCEVPVPEYTCAFPVSLCTLCLSSVVHSQLKADVFPACRSTGARERALGFAGTSSGTPAWRRVDGVADGKRFARYPNTSCGLSCFIAQIAFPLTIINNLRPSPLYSSSGNKHTVWKSVDSKCLCAITGASSRLRGDIERHSSFFQLGGGWMVSQMANALRGTRIQVAAFPASEHK